jgi:enoyl-CoA hydratase
MARVYRVHVFSAALAAAARFAEGPAVAIGAAKAAINMGSGRAYPESLGLERDLACGLFDSEAQLESMQAFLGSRPPLFKVH